jgi:hypothetical protein
MPKQVTLGKCFEFTANGSGKLEICKIWTFDCVNNDMQSILCANTRQEGPSSEVHSTGHEIQNNT